MLLLALIMAFVNPAPVALLRCINSFVAAHEIVILVFRLQQTSQEDQTVFLLKESWSLGTKCNGMNNK